MACKSTSLKGEVSTSVSGKFPARSVHGGRVRHCQSVTGRDLIDFSANLNPFVPEFTWNPDIQALSDYPDDTYSDLKSVIARTFQRTPDEICVGNGSVELIRAFCYAALKKGGRYYLEPPTFGEYELAAELAGAARAQSENEANVRFLCNPNNPTGTLLPREEVLAVLDRVSDNGSFLFLDEAFIELSDPAESLSGVRDGHLFILRSLTKCFSVPGLRFGYGFGDPDLIARIEVVRLPWTVNVLAEDYAIQAFRHYDELRSSRRLIAEERSWLCSQLADLNLRYERPSANFILVHVPLPASALAGRLLDHDLLVRDCTSFGLPDAIRIAVRTHPENRLLMEALRECLP